MFTVLIAAYNAEKHIEETLRSLIAQQYQNWQCIIVTNGCTDKTGEIVDSYVLHDSRFQRLNLEFANKSAALNAGVIEATSEWIAILDADDIWIPDKLRLQYEFLSQHYDIDVLGTQLQYIDVISRPLPNAPMLPVSSKDISDSFRRGNNAIANSSAVYRRKLHRQFGYYDVEIFVEDYDWWKRLARKNVNFQNLEDKCLLHRVHSSSNFNASNRQQIYKQVVDRIDEIYRHE